MDVLVTRIVRSEKTAGYGAGCVSQSLLRPARCPRKCFERESFPARKLVTSARRLLLRVALLWSKGMWFVDTVL